jgi:hypothetical protein
VIVIQIDAGKYFFGVRKCKFLKKLLFIFSEQKTNKKQKVEILRNEKAAPRKPGYRFLYL